MAEREPIRVRAYVTVDGRETDLDMLPKAQRRAACRALKLAYLNALFQGEAVFTEKGEKPRLH